MFNKNINNILLLIILFFAFYIRIIDLNMYFGNEDDLAVARNIITAKLDKSNNELDAELVKYYVVKNGIEEYKSNSSQYKKYLRLQNTFGINFLKKINDYGYLEQVIYSINFIIAPFSISLRTTYAPLQFFITNFIVNPDQTYREILFWGRFPSFCFSIATIILMVCFYKKILKNNNGLIPALLILTFSVENIIIAKQMHCYSLGVFSSLLLLFISMSEGVILKNSKFKLFKLFFIPVILSYSNYQILFFIPAYYITIFYRNFLEDKNIKLWLPNLCFSLVLYFLFIIPLLFIFLLPNFDRGSPIPQYLYNYLADESALRNLINFITYIFKNTFLTIGAVSSYVSILNPSFFTIKILTTVIMIIGYISIFFKDSKLYNSLFIFISLIITTWLILLFNQKIMLSPTRHSLILIPIVSILIGEGVHYIIRFFSKLISNKYFNSKNFLQLASIILTIFISTTYFSFYKGMLIENKDPFDEDVISNLIDEYNVEAIFEYENTFNVGLMKKIYNKIPIYEFSSVSDGNGKKLEYKSYSKINEYRTVAFISSQKRLTDDIYKKILMGYSSSSITKLNPTNIYNSNILYSEVIDSKLNKLDLPPKFLTNNYYIYIVSI